MESSEHIREILRKVRQVEIRTRRLVTDAMVGAYHSSFKGRGMDFEEVREYAPGDDVRAIDWNVTAKMDRPFIKLYREERELCLMLLIDVSASGIYGSGASSKRELAAELASVLAFSALRNNDKVGLILFTDHVEHYIPPKKGRAHCLRLIREILFFKPRERGTDIPHALDFMNRVTRRRALCFLISDFLEHPALPDSPTHPSDHEATLKALALTHQRHDLITFVLSDPHEHTLPDVGIVTLEDAETGSIIELDTSSPSVRQRYAKENTARSEHLLKSIRQRGVDVLPITTDKPYINTLRFFFNSRSHRS